MQSGTAPSVGVFTVQARRTRKAPGSDGLGRLQRDYLDPEFAASWSVLHNMLDMSYDQFLFLLSIRSHTFRAFITNILSRAYATNISSGTIRAHGKFNSCNVTRVLQYLVETDGAWEATLDAYYHSIKVINNQLYVTAVLFYVLTPIILSLNFPFLIHIFGGLLACSSSTIRSTQSYFDKRCLSKHCTDSGWIYPSAQSSWTFTRSKVSRNNHGKASHDCWHFPRRRP